MIIEYTDGGFLAVEHGECMRAISGNRNITEQTIGISISLLAPIIHNGLL